jgi:para-aminobenzoate synthetase/4-amino-4-deoxychorismate lyase
MAVHTLAATLVRERLPVRVAAHDALRALRGDERPFALVGAWFGGGAVLGSEPVRVAVGEDVLGRLDDMPPVAAPAVGNAIAWGAVGNESEPRAAGSNGSESEIAGAGEQEPPVVGGGWVGYLGFELRHAVEPGHPPPPRPVPLSGGALAFYDHVLRLDAAGRWWFEALWTPERAAELDRRREELTARLTAPLPRGPFATSDWRWTPSLAAHARAVEACRERIAAGDLFQANLCLRLEGSLDGDPLDLFAAAVAALPTDRAAFVAGPWGALASLSPELFLAHRDRTVRSAPIKGTRPWGARAELAASAKDRAENVMIVDLVRNDLGRVCRPGGVQVSALAEPRPHAGVWHLVSEVEGELVDGIRDADLLRATFPPGSVTGAPKLAALDVIAELESTGREAYTGAIGMAGPLAGLELSVAIRTFEIRGDRIWLGVGGGVVADSDGAAEAREAAAKAAPLLAAIGADVPPADESASGSLAVIRVERPPASAPAGAALPATIGADVLPADEQRETPPRVVRRGPRPVPRPDPAAGLYETLLVEDGAARHVAAHLARLSASLRVLYGRPLPPELAERIADAARGLRGRARLRMDVTPDLDVAFASGPLPAAGTVVLRPVVVPGGLGPHKWRDRALLESHERDDPATMPLLLDADGRVLEASRASIVARASDGALHTPPADGRILPGTACARSGAAARVLTLADVRAAPELYVASALRELQPATVIDR